jgi:hypothetical protein
MQKMQNSNRKFAFTGIGGGARGEECSHIIKLQVENKLMSSFVACLVCILSGPSYMFVIILFIKLLHRLNRLNTVLLLYIGGAIFWNGRNRKS